MTSRPWSRCTLLLASLAVGALSCAAPQPEKEGTITITGAMEDGISKAPLPNAEICVHEHDDVPCVRSDLGAKFTLPNVPQNQEIMLKFFAGGYFQHLAMFTTTDQDEDFTYGLVSDAGMDLMAGTVGVSIDGDKAQIIVGTNNMKGGDRVEGVSFAISPAQDASKGPFYQDANGLDETLTATTAKGIGAFLNLDPGDYEITFTHPTFTCKANFAWKGSAENSLKVRTIPTHSSYVSAICN